MQPPPQTTASAPHPIHTCTVCSATFVDYRQAWEHIRTAHPEVPRADMVQHIAEMSLVPDLAVSQQAQSGAAVLGARPARRTRSGTPAILLAHWYHLIEGLQTSSLGFYQGIEQALGHRAVPDTATARTDYRESGFLSAKREYLRITRGAQAIDICAAPFGTGFFVSWWLGEARPGPLIPTVALLAVLIVDFRIFGAFFGLGFLVLGFLGLGALISQGEAPWHAYVFAVPFLGQLWERLFQPLTLYRYDTMLMFKSAVHKAVLEVIDGLTDAQGLRRLSDDERKPIMRDFWRR